MGPQDFEASLHSVERSQRLAAEVADEAAEASRDELAELPHLWPGGVPQDERRRVTDEIAAHEATAANCRRRADYAAAGYLLVGDNERSDPDWMQRHQEILPHAYRHGRVKHSSDRLDARDAESARLSSVVTTT
jgi:hypothetical protein